jgi:hypothetical protein
METLARWIRPHHIGHQRRELRYVRIHDSQDPGYATTRPDHPPTIGTSQPHQQAEPEDLRHATRTQALSEPPRVGDRRVRSPPALATPGR